MRDDSVKPEFPDKVPGDLHLSWGRDSHRDLLERWPTTPEGEPVTPAFLTKCGQVDLEDRLLVNMLEAYGIPCLTRYPHSGEFGKVVLGMSGFGTMVATGCSSSSASGGALHGLARFMIWIGKSMDWMVPLGITPVVLTV